ncbi:MAG: DNA mismatch repair protein MutS [Candidatus Anoxychlamydiales bacterium]|nr:DNA mismatch repair protein MutS [Candidatus Anoxychlamydiales bacterium]
MNLTPMMKQYKECKEQSKGALLFFRLGDFYEAFYDDAIIISKALNLTLTKRAEVPMCGVPFHAVDNYIDRLIAKGNKVAIAEQLENPKDVKGIVKRGVVRILSPATVINSSLIKEKSNNFFLSINQINNTYGFAIIDITTSEFNVFEIENEKDLLDEIYKIKPLEILISQKFLKNNEQLIESLKNTLTFVLNVKEDFYFDYQIAYDSLISHFKISSLDSFGLKGMLTSISSAGALISYLLEDLQLNLNHIKSVKPQNLSSYMILDYSCMRNLEIVESNVNNQTSTLLSLLDKTATAMGGRLLKQWLKFPLLDINKILDRQNAIQEILDNKHLFYDVHLNLDKIRDLNRIIMRITSGYATPKDLGVLKFSLSFTPKIKKLLKGFKSKLIVDSLINMQDITPLLKLLETAIVDDPPLRISDGGIFKDGFDQNLDEIRSISKDSLTWLTNYQNSLKEKYGIKSLKVGFNKVFGYFITVSRGQADKVPDTFIRKQTLVNQERFITEELKVFEQKVLSSDSKIKLIETKLYETLRNDILKYSADITNIAKSIAKIDILYSFAKCAHAYNYIKPNINASDEIDIIDGRHPIIEKNITHSSFIANDTHLNNTTSSLFIITGPNMAGKSTYIRQVALIVIMAQIGSFVPAKKADIGLVDRIFSRIGASDDLSRGQSTFMVEMMESANILNNATHKSLIILDEIGRGTSTYDGISIAYSVCEYLLNNKNKKAKTLFATHFSELIDLEKKYKSAINYNVAVKEIDSKIVFLRKIVKGSTSKSYGIHVAKLAGLPNSVIKRANEILLELERKKENKPNKITSNFQFSLFEEKEDHNKKVIDDIKKIDINNITPIEALKKLLSIKENIKK